MAKKNLKVTALRYEINFNIDKVLTILQKLNLIEKSANWSESQAFDWIADEPTEQDMDRVLKELGY